MKKAAKNTLIWTGAAAAVGVAATVVSYTAMKSLVRIALDREQPKVYQKQKARLSGSGGQSELFEGLSEASERLKNGGCETVEITAQDGERLVGHLHRCENAKRLIIAMHGWRSSWSCDFGVISDFWNESGCSVLYAEQRGQGASGGEYMGFGLTERYDCLDWANWANRNGFDSLPIYLCGISMGATTVLMAAGLNLPENVHGIMADCGFTSPHAIWKHVMEHNLHISYKGINAAIANGMCKKKIQIGARDYSCTEALKKSNTPVFFVHGTDDRFVPVEMTYENYKACSAPKRLLIVPGAEHGMSYLVDKDNYEKALRDFWKDFD